jgi:hypothetical protein
MAFDTSPPPDSDQNVALTKRLPNQIKMDNFIKKEKLTEAQ